MKIKAIFMAALLLIALAPAAFSQSRDTGAIEGVVMDEQRAPLPGVAVMISGPSLVGTRSVVTDVSGRFLVPALPPGVYAIRAELTGFSTTIQENVRLSTMATINVNVTLMPAPRLTKPAATQPRLETPTGGPLSAAQQRILHRLKLDLLACAGGSGDYPIPRVTRYSPMERALPGGTITFHGTNFIPGRIRACIGEVRLRVLSATVIEFSVRAPDSNVTGPLLVSHGTRDSLYPLAEEYRVFADAAPTISSIRPSSFRYGEEVVISGTALQRLNPGRITRPNSQQLMDVVRIGSNDSPLSDLLGDGVFQHTAPDPYFMEIVNFVRAADGTKATFYAGHVYEHLYGGAHHDYTLRGDPSEVRGTIRFPAGGDGNYGLVGTSVMWQPARFALDRVRPPAWNGQVPRFVIACDQVAVAARERVDFTGSDLDGAVFKLGDRRVHPILYMGARGSFPVTPDMPSGVFNVTKGGRTLVDRGGPITVIPMPRFLPESVRPPAIRLKLGEIHELRGWDLLPPSSVRGLAYEFFVNFPQHLQDRLNVTIEVVSHTASVVRLRAVATGELPAHMLGQAPFNGSFYMDPHHLQVKATYGGVTRVLWHMPYTIIVE